MEHRIIQTRQDGGVSIICPSARCVEVLQEGGGLGHAIPVGMAGRRGLRRFLSETLRISETELKRMHRAGCVPSEHIRAWEIEKLFRCSAWRPDRPDRRALATKWVDRLIWGGCTYEEALELIRDKDAEPFSVAHEIVHVRDLPQDRTHRDAWRRSSNGGPIWIDEKRAHQIDEAQMWSRYFSSKRRAYFDA